MDGDKLRIAMLSAHSCPVGDLGAKDTGGMSVYIRELAYELGGLGHSVDVFTRVHDPADPQIVDLGHGARLIHLKAGREESINKLLMYCYLPEFSCNLENFRSANRLNYDVVFSHYWLSGWVGENLQRWWRIPHVIMFHTLGAIKNAVGVGEESPELRVMSEKESIQKCQRIIVATEREKEALQLRYNALPEKIGVVPCGVNMQLFHPLDREDARRRTGLSGEKVILFVGRIDPLKGIDRLLESLLHLKDIPDVKLIIIGGDERDRSELEKLQRRSCELGLTERVRFQGLVKQEELPYYYSAADVCVVSSYYESFGLVALEALACGTPVVATDVGNLREILYQGGTGYVIPDNSPENLAAGIRLFLSRPPRDEATVNLIRSSVSDFKWSSVAEGITRELRKVLEERMTPVA
jgi:D-inositol-3-phosphate glycosyltransferase